MKNWSILIFVMGLTLACGSNNNQQKTENPMGNSYLFMVGTYTETAGDGIHLVKFNPDSSKFESLGITSGVENPSFVIANADEDLVFTVEETGGDQGGKVTSFRLDKPNKSMVKINSVYTKGDSPCYLSLDPSEKFLVAANYSGGNVTAIPLDAQGNLSQEIQVVKHNGNSIHPGRQKSSHVHSAVFHPKEQKVFVGDLGTDKIHVYTFDEESLEPLTPADEITFAVKPGSGPRHLVFNENGDRLYLVHEITAEIGVYAYENETISHLETKSLLEEGYQGEVGAAEVRLSPDEKFLYASNRGEAHAIIAFGIDQETGRLSQVQHQSSLGKTPRNFAITTDGMYLISANQESNSLTVFERDLQTGKLKPLDATLPLKKPVYINFLK